MALYIDTIADFSNIGPRDCNEDRALTLRHKGQTLMLVSDGMGGYEGGAEASAAIARAFSESFTSGGDIFLPRTLAGLLDDLSNEIALTGIPGAGGTLAMAVYDGRRLRVVTVGDSRVYLFRHGREISVSHDDSLVQQMVDDGSITREEARLHPRRNVITRCISAKRSLSGTPETQVWRPKPGDILVLCSDGVWEAFDAETLAGICSAGFSPEEISSALQDRLAEIATDNHTAVIARFRRRCIFDFLFKKQ